MNHLSIDLETFSSVPIAKAGLYKYAQSPDFEILLFAYSFDGAPPAVIDFTAGERLPADVLHALRDPACIKHAYNAAFEWYCLEQAGYLSGLSRRDALSQWRDTMLHALYCGVPGSLDAAGKALGLPGDKRKLTTGRALIRTFCVPRTPTARDPRTRIRPQDEPEKWELFKAYNRQDVATEMEIECRLIPWPVPEPVQAQWITDQIINARGVQLDLGLVRGALGCSEVTTAQLTAEAAELSGLQNPNSVTQLAAWLQAETGEEIADLRKDTVADLLEAELPNDKARRMLEIRQELGKTSVKKYAAMNTAVCADGRVRGLLQFYGANRTGRWAGRIIQPQNLPRTYLHGAELDRARTWVQEQKPDYISLLCGPVPDILSQLIRTALVASDGCCFVDADFSAIEARVIAWLAGEDWVLEVFRTHGKIYEAQASQMFGVPIENIVKGRPEYALRQRGKVATLALGYQGGTGSLVSMGALRMGIPEADLPDIVQRWRQANRRIVDLWYGMESAALDTMKSGRENAIRGIRFALTGSRDRGFLTVTLPSGRQLFYAQPSLGTNRFGRESLQYMGVDQSSKKWHSLETYGGKLTENVVQAIARDCLAEKLEQLETAGYPVVFHVHDEVVIDCPHDRADLDAVCKILGASVSWAPGLPLAADGWVGDYYTKD